MRHRVFFIGALAILLSVVLAAQQPPAPAKLAPEQQPSAPPAPQTSSLGRPLTTVVLDPAHGGTDSGARGATGVLEKDVTLQLARAVKAQLESHGLRVVLTRDADQSLSQDDRAAIANAREGCVFVSLHVGSTGEIGTARAYYFAMPAATAAPPAGQKPLLVRWEEAQARYTELSHELASLVQVQLGQKLRNSPDVPVSGAVRQLRMVSAPAIAVELSSVSVTDRKPLDAAAGPLAEAVARGVTSFQPVFAAGGR